ncbi:hypothetical protein [Amaricoccus sp.]|uniref:hypothetical protein n=1 Tax=Amaricoccus sp. TaxID=1872485 RepID=UPI001B53CE23|nr:hypothetical protein [Amaricoccus sp.]MBP7241854.1 hypothetical protein [Amaricoccus sp.]
MKKKFLLCVGCQKGGTTWLAEYLEGAPGFRLGAQKEMHVLDTHFFAPDWLQGRLRSDRDLLAKLPAGAEAEREEVTERIAARELCQGLVGDLDAYARYFRDLAKSADVVADMTPNYALLTAAQWRSTRDALERNGLAPRILFLMRDPERRMESAWRMRERNARGSVAPRSPRPVPRWRLLLRRASGPAGAQAASNHPYLAFASNDNLARSRYETTIRAIEQVFPAEDIHYAFYENLFRPDTIAAINAFLGLPDRPADFGARVNASPVVKPIDPAERARVRALLEPTYRFCEERFGEGQIRAIWKR